MSYATEWPKALQPRPTLPTEDVLKAELHVLKLTHNPLWDAIDFGPVWHDLHDAWIETGLGRPHNQFFTSFSKPGGLGDWLNKNTWR